ncbi:MAG: winged helix-turn-helix transcriptional regulator [Thermoplasmata archaeon]|nr:MAG: winged helix-turn-helix transcriptional regulator [Thermoplasmata archaeon]
MDDGEGGLAHKTRKQIYNYILTYPGASFGDIQKLFDLKTSTLTYHLTYLERSQKIYSRREGRRRLYYGSYGAAASEGPPPDPKINSLTEIQQGILNVIQNQPGITKDELISKTRLNQNVLNYNIDRLSDLKMIWVVKADGVMGYEYITKEKLRNEIFNRLVMKLIKDEIDEETYFKIKKKLEEMDLEELDAIL